MADNIRSDDIATTGFPAPDLTTSTNVLNEILETEEGRKMAGLLKDRMESLSERFKNLGPEEREKFQREFGAKFQDAMQNLKQVVQEKVGASVRTRVYTELGIQIFGVVLLISVIG